MTIDLQSLRSAALAASPGPWTLDLVYESQRGAPDYAHIKAAGLNVPVATVMHREEDAKFIAAASPSVVLALLDLIDEWTAAESCQQAERDDLQARLTAAEAGVSGWRNFAQCRQLAATEHAARADAAEARLASAEGVVEAARGYVRKYPTAIGFDAALAAYDADTSRAAKWHVRNDEACQSDAKRDGAGEGGA